MSNEKKSPPKKVFKDKPLPNPVLGEQFEKQLWRARIVAANKQKGT